MINTFTKRLIGSIFLGVVWSVVSGFLSALISVFYFLGFWLPAHPSFTVLSGLGMLPSFVFIFSIFGVAIGFVVGFLVYWFARFF